MEKNIAFVREIVFKKRQMFWQKQLLNVQNTLDQNILKQLICEVNDTGYSVIDIYDYLFSSMCVVRWGLYIILYN